MIFFVKWVNMFVDCFCLGSRKDDMGDSADSTAYVIDAVSRLDINPDVNMKTDPTDENHPVLGIPECKCGMPLCICEAPVPSRDALPLQV